MNSKLFFIYPSFVICQLIVGYLLKISFNMEDLAEVYVLLGRSLPTFSFNLSSYLSFVPFFILRLKRPAGAINGSTSSGPKKGRGGGSMQNQLVDRAFQGLSYGGRSSRGRGRGRGFRGGFRGRGRGRGGYH